MRGAREAELHAGDDARATGMELFVGEFGDSVEDYRRADEVMVVRGAEEGEEVVNAAGEGHRVDVLGVADNGLESVDDVLTALGDRAGVARGKEGRKLEDEDEGRVIGDADFAVGFCGCAIRTDWCRSGNIGFDYHYFRRGIFR